MMTTTAAARIVTRNCPIYAPAALNIERVLIRSVVLLLPPILDVDEELSWPKKLEITRARCVSFSCEQKRETQTQA